MSGVITDINRAKVAVTITPMPHRGEAVQVRVTERTRITLKSPTISCTLTGGHNKILKREGTVAQQDVTRVMRENIDAFNAGDWQRVKATMTPDSVYEELGTQRRIHGADEVIKADQGWKQAFPDAKGTIRNIFAGGSAVTAEVVWEGTHRGALAGPGGSIPATGKRVKMPAVLVATVQGGKIKEVHPYFDMMTLLQQLGVTPGAHS